MRFVSLASDLGLARGPHNQVPQVGYTLGTPDLDASNNQNQHRCAHLDRVCEDDARER
jgi:hypothetical protein